MAKVEYNFDNIPARALNVSSRNFLCKLLNSQMEIPTTKHFCKDYRGLAELMEFDYMTIRSFEATGNPTKKLLEEWEVFPHSTIGRLLEILKQIERYDIIDDIQDLIAHDAKSYLLRKQRSQEAPVQVAEVTSVSKITLYGGDDDDEDILTVDDVYIRQNNNSSEVASFDAYVCFGEEDAPFVYKLAEYLESPGNGIKLCIKERNLMAGNNVYESLVRIIEQRCSRMLIILSPEFLKSAECKFLTRYATGLGVSQRQRKLIPLIYKPCPIPALLKYVSKVDFTKADVHDWIWKKLLVSVKGAADDDIIIPSSTFCESLCSAYRTPFLNFTSQNIPMLNVPPQSRSRSISPQPSNSAPTSLISLSSAASTSNLNVSPPTKAHISRSVSPNHRRKWFPKFSEIFSSSSSHSSSGNSSSGFHSQSNSRVIVSSDAVEQLRH